MVRRLHDAGAVLVAKLSLGALALNDIWFGGQTMNPWLPGRRSVGLKRRSGGRYCCRIGRLRHRERDWRQHREPFHALRNRTGLRPTYGRVPRTGAMTLCWSLNKLGPMTRSVEDAMQVLQAISGPDAGDVDSVPSKIDFDAGASVEGLRVGYFPAWMNERPPLTSTAKLWMQLRNWVWSRLRSLFRTGRMARSI